MTPFRCLFCALRMQFSWTTRERSSDPQTSLLSICFVVGACKVLLSGALVACVVGGTLLLALLRPAGACASGRVRPSVSMRAPPLSRLRVASPARLHAVPLWRLCPVFLLVGGPALPAAGVPPRGGRLSAALRHGSRYAEALLRLDVWRGKATPSSRSRRRGARLLRR